jgi:homogentisate 1,2-dioxygenase
VSFGIIRRATERYSIHCTTCRQSKNVCLLHFKFILFFSWLYRIRPSVVHKPFVPYKKNENITAQFDANASPQQYRWMPPEIPTQGTVDFVDGLFTVCGAGNAQVKNGFAIHQYAANSSMQDRALCNSDGDFLIVPEHGALTIRTEMGMLLVQPKEICVIPRGIRFSVALKNGPIRGYIAEVFNGHFTIPDLGPIGANGLANPRFVRGKK